MKIKDEKERPLECSCCKKELKVKYTEVKEQVSHCFYMCEDCPVLKQYLLKPKFFKDYEKSSQISCGHCHTSLIEMQRGESLGCFTCYEVFEYEIIKELDDNQYLPGHLDFNDSLHQGHKPGEVKEVSPSLQIFALKETLGELLNREDYEQAAYIRDKIKELKKRQKKDEP